MKIGNYEFDGPFFSIPSLEDRPGVYAILCVKDEKFDLIDVGEARAVKTGVQKNKRKECWNINALDGILKFVVYYVSDIKQSGRRKIEQELREEYKPPCGKKIKRKQEKA